MLLPEGAPQAAVDELNRQLGLKEPLHVQYGIFLRSVFRGDFGQSSSTAPPPSWSSGSACRRPSS
jgi:peptide/nickel transport system permease protein